MCESITWGLHGNLADGKSERILLLTRPQKHSARLKPEPGESPAIRPKTPRVLNPNPVEDDGAPTWTFGTTTKSSPHPPWEQISLLWLQDFGICNIPFLFLLKLPFPSLYEYRYTGMGTMKREVVRGFRSPKSFRIETPARTVPQRRFLRWSSSLVRQRSLSLGIFIWRFAKFQFSHRVSLQIHVSMQRFALLSSRKKLSFAHSFLWGNLGSMPGSCNHNL